MSKELKGNMKMISQQIEYINKKIEIIKNKEPKRNPKIEKSN